MEQLNTVCSEGLLSVDPTVKPHSELMKNYFDPLWYGRLGYGMTWRAVNVYSNVVYSNRNTVYIGSGRNGK